jgi:hypothetical protein
VALDADVVAGRQLVGRGFLDGQVRFFDLETKKEKNLNEILGFKMNLT